MSFCADFIYSVGSQTRRGADGCLEGELDCAARISLEACACIYIVSLTSVGIVQTEIGLDDREPPACYQLGGSVLPCLI